MPTPRSQAGRNLRPSPPYRFGPLQGHPALRLTGAPPPGFAHWQRVRRSRNARCTATPGQQRLLRRGVPDAGHREPRPGSPVIAQVREAPAAKAGVWCGPVHRQRTTPVDGPQPQPVAHARLARGEQTRRSTKCTATGHGLDGLPNDNGWRWFTSALAQRQQTGDYDVNSVEVLGGRSKSTKNIDRTYFCATTPPAPGLNAPPTACAERQLWLDGPLFQQQHGAHPRAGALPWNWALA